MTSRDCITCNGEGFFALGNITCPRCKGTGTDPDAPPPGANAPPEKCIYPHCAPEGPCAPQCDAAHNPS